MTSSPSGSFSTHLLLLSPTKETTEQRSPYHVFGHQLLPTSPLLPMPPNPRPPERLPLEAHSSDLGPAPHPSFLCGPTPKQPLKPSQRYPQETSQESTNPGGSLHISTPLMSSPNPLTVQVIGQAIIPPPPSHSWQTLPDQTQILCHEALQLCTPNTCTFWTF